MLCCAALTNLYHLFYLFLSFIWFHIIFIYINVLIHCWLSLFNVTATQWDLFYKRITYLNGLVCVHLLFYVLKKNNCGFLFVLTLRSIYDRHLSQHNNTIIRDMLCCLWCKIMRADYLLIIWQIDYKFVI